MKTRFSDVGAEDILRAVNPVPPSNRDSLAGQLPVAEGVRRVLERAASEQTHAPREPRRRLGGSHRFRYAVAAAVGAFSLLVGTALGISPNIIAFFDSPSPDQATQDVVFSLAQGAPAGMDPRLLPENARLVGTVGTRQLWAAPTKSGGMCFGWVGTGGGCDRLGTLPLDASISYSGDRRSVNHVSGFVNTRYAEGLVIDFRDGEIARPTLLNVSAPIRAAFYSYSVPESRRTPEKTVVAVRATDGDGNTVSTFGVPLAHLPMPDPISDAIVSDRRSAAHIETRDGSAEIWTAPTRYGGTCAWAEVGGSYRFLAPCQAAGYELDGFSIQPIVTAKTVVLAGTVSERFKGVTVSFADGKQEHVATSGGFLLYEVPADHLTEATRATSVEALDASSEAVKKVPIGPGGSCWSGLPADVSPRPSGCTNAVELHGS